jgi:hypothetical protein
MLMQVYYVRLDYSFQFCPHLHLSIHKPDLLFSSLHSGVFQCVLSVTATDKFEEDFEHRLTQSLHIAYIITSLRGKLNLRRI